MIHPTIHRELAKQREADFHRAADNARRSAQVHRERPSLVTLAPAVAALDALGMLMRRRPHTA